MRVDVWDFGGYKIVDENKKEISLNSHSISTEEINQGYYLASFEMKKRNTPKNWIWIIRMDVEAFIDPNKMQEFIQKYKLEPFFKLFYCRLKNNITWATSSFFSISNSSIILN